MMIIRDPVKIKKKKLNINFSFTTNWNLEVAFYIFEYISVHIINIYYKLIST